MSGGKPFQAGGAEAIAAAYQEIRSPDSPSCCALFGYEGQYIFHLKTVASYEDEDLVHCYEDLVHSLEDDSINYAFVRFGDDKVKKFVFITWIGSLVTPRRKAKAAEDKQFMKEIITSFGLELWVEGNRNDLRYESVLNALSKVSGVPWR